MPRIPNIPGPYHLLFYSFDCNEPMHVHVRRERTTCKFWLDPVALAANDGFSPRELNRIRDIIVQYLNRFRRRGVSTVANDDPRIVSVKVDDEVISATLADGRTISVPLAWSWRLSAAAPEQRQRFEIIGNGQGIHWPDIDEDLSARGMLHGMPARPPKQPA